MSVLVTVQAPLTVKHRAMRRPAKPAARRGTPLWIPVTILLGLLLGVGVGYGYVVFAGLRNSTATEHAVQLAIENKSVSQFLGGPVQVGYFVSGNIYDHYDGTGNADLAIFVKGPSGSGTLYATEREVKGAWYADKLTFRPDGDLEMIQVKETRPLPQTSLLTEP